MSTQPVFRADLLTIPPNYYSDAQPFMPCEMSAIDDSEFLIYLLPAHVLLSSTSIPRHEDVIDDLLCISAKELQSSQICNQSIFISHRWVNNSPDSEDCAQLHYIQKVLRLFKYTEGMYVWIDYSCMKQDTPDLPTIRRLNYILSFTDLFMIVLPEYDADGAEYVKRVWCIYEWLSVLHFKRTFIFPSQDFSNQFLKHTLESVAAVLDPFFIHYLEQFREQCGSIMPLMVEHVSQLYVEGGIFSKDAFVSSLQAFKDEDKSYVHTNLSTLFNPLDLLNLYLLGNEDCPSLQCIGVKELEQCPASIVLGCQQHLEPTSKAALKNRAAQIARLLPPSAWSGVSTELLEFMPPLPPGACCDLPLHRPLEELLQEAGKQGATNSAIDDDYSSSSSLSSLGIGGKNWRDFISSSSSSSLSSEEQDREEHRNEEKVE